MAVRLRLSGEVVCAAMHPEQPGDQYIDDGVAYTLSVEQNALVTEPMDLDPVVGRGGHSQHGLWWWRNEVPPDVTIDPFYIR